jgi:fibronectin type 3 domain-containing protein
VGASLTGTGMAALQHSVALNWNSSSSSVVGYNIYRGGNSGGPYNKLSSSLDSSTSYMDQNVQAGATYYYVVTSVDGSGTESVFSNQVKAVVPTP